MLLVSVCVQALALFLFFLGELLQYSDDLCRLQSAVVNFKASSRREMLSTFWILLSLNLQCPRLHFSSSWKSSKLRYEQVLIDLVTASVRQVMLCTGFNCLVQHVLKICRVSPRLPFQKGLNGEQGVPKTGIWCTRSRT